jgi:hypothetical protein
LIETSEARPGAIGSTWQPRAPSMLAHTIAATHRMESATKHHAGKAGRASMSTDAGSPSSSDRCTRDAVRVADLMALRLASGMLSRRRVGGNRLRYGHRNISTNCDDDRVKYVTSIGSESYSDLGGPMSGNPILRAWSRFRCRHRAPLAHLECEAG